MTNKFEIVSSIIFHGGVICNLLTNYFGSSLLFTLLPFCLKSETSISIAIAVNTGVLNRCTLWTEVLMNQAGVHLTQHMMMLQGTSIM